MQTEFFGRRRLHLAILHRNELCRQRRGETMIGNALAKLRSSLVHGLAVAAVVLTYAVGSVGLQIASTVGVSGLMLATTATPAQARRFRRRFAPRRRFVRRRRFLPRRRFARRRWWGGY